MTISATGQMFRMPRFSSEGSLRQAQRLSGQLEQLEPVLRQLVADPDLGYSLSHLHPPPELEALPGSGVWMLKAQRTLSPLLTGLLKAVAQMMDREPETARSGDPLYHQRHVETALSLASIGHEGLERIEANLSDSRDPANWWKQTPGQG